MEVAATSSSSVKVIGAFSGQKIAVGERVGFFTEDDHILIHGSVCYVISAPRGGRWNIFWFKTTDVMLPEFFCGECAFEEGGCVKAIQNEQSGETRIRPWHQYREELRDANTD